MKTITLKVDGTIFLRHPGFRRAIIVAKGVENKGDLGREISREVEQVKSLNPDDGRLTVWREAFAREGMKVRDFRPSIDALVKRIHTDKPLGSINPIVDVGTVVSLKFVLPAGAHPILNDTSEVSLEPASGDETDVTLDGKSEVVNRGEIILKDSGRLASRRWVWRQTPLSRISSDTTDFFLNIDALSIINDNELNEAVSFARSLIKLTFGIETTVIILSSQNATAIVKPWYHGAKPDTVEI